MKKRILSILLVLMMCLGIVGALADEQVTLKFTYWGSTVEKKAVENAIKAFEEANPNIKVNGLHIPTDYEAKITTMMAGNESPDVAYLSDTLCNEWASEGKLVNVLELMETDDELKADDHLDAVWYSWEPGKALGTNTAVECYATFYNKDIFDEMGVAYPPTKPEEAWTWDEFVAVAKSLTVDQNGKHPDEDGFDPTRIKQYGVQFPTGINAIIGFIYGNDGGLITPDGKEFAFNKPEAIEVLQAIADLMNVHHVAPTPVAAKSIPEISTALQSKKCAMVIQGQWVLLDLAANNRLSFGVAALPKYGEKYVTSILGGATAIFADTKHLEESWKLYKWLNNPESSLELQAGGLWMPLLKDWYTEPELIEKWAVNNPAHPEGYTDAVMRAAIEYGMSGAAYNVKNYGKISALLVPALDGVWLGTVSAQEAMDAIAPEINKLVDGFYNTERTY